MDSVSSHAPNIDPLSAHVEICWNMGWFLEIIHFNGRYAVKNVIYTLHHP